MIWTVIKDVDVDEEKKDDNMSEEKIFTIFLDFTIDKIYVKVVTIVYIFHLKLLG